MWKYPRQCFIFSVAVRFVRVPSIVSVLLTYSLKITSLLFWRICTGVNPAGDAGDTSPNILVGGRQREYPPILLRTFGYSRPILVALRSLSLKPFSFGYKTPPIRFSPLPHPRHSVVRPPPTLNSRWRHCVYDVRVCVCSTCEFGQWNCTQKTCAKICAVISLQHIRTFDGQEYDIRGPPSNLTMVEVLRHCSLFSSLLEVVGNRLKHLS